MNNFLPSTDLTPMESSSRIEEIQENSPEVSNVGLSENNGDNDDGNDDDDNDLIMDDIGVVVEDRPEHGLHDSEMEEDLLNYDSDNEGNDNSNDETSLAYANIRNTAKKLLGKSPNKVILKYQDDCFLLFDYKESQRDNSEDLDSFSTFPIICQNSEVNSSPSNVLMGIIRQFLESYYGKIRFATKEILMTIPVLDITLFEDNIYNNQISFEDIQTVFKILKTRSEQNKETDIPSYLEGTIELRPRFVARYNTLVELTESSATLRNIRPFSNDQSHPLVLDDTVPDSDEIIVMNIDDDDDDIEQDIKEVGKSNNVESDNSSHQFKKVDIETVKEQKTETSDIHEEQDKE